MAGLPVQIGPVNGERRRWRVLVLVACAWLFQGQVIDGDWDALYASRMQLTHNPPALFVHGAGRFVGLNHPERSHLKPAILHVSNGFIHHA